MHVDCEESRGPVAGGTDNVGPGRARAGRLAHIKVGRYDIPYGSSP